MRQSFHLLRFTFCNDCLKAIIVVQMNMLAGNNELVKIVLDIGRFIYQFSFVVLVDKCAGSGDFFALQPLFFLRGFRGLNRVWPRSDFHIPFLLYPRQNSTEVLFQAIPRIVPVSPFLAPFLCYFFYNSNASPLYCQQFF